MAVTNAEIIARACFTLGIEGDVHAYAEWKRLGYNVKKGEKARFKTSIWKHSSKENDSSDEEIDKSNYFYPKLSAFFTVDQVEKIKENYND